MEEHKLLTRYYSQLILDDISISDQTHLWNKHVSVVGLGGLGSPLAVYLVAAGLGKVTLLDSDCVEVKNLHRQVFYTQNDLGIKKVQCLGNHLKKINPKVEVNLIPQKSWEVKFSEFRSDLIIDCADNLKTTYELNSKCVINNLPFSTASISGYQGQVFMFNNTKESHCCYECLFEEVGDLNENDCADVGVLGPSVSMIASIQAQCVLKKLLNKPILEDGILRIDTSTMQIKKNKINTNYSCKLSP